eukprot:EG_transcript_11410
MSLNVAAFDNELNAVQGLERRFLVMVTCKGIQDVAVIGAGAAGLAAAKALREVGFSVAVYERLPAPGGVWLYRPNEGPMYDNLVTNIPKEVMQFTDVPFPSAWNSYCHHTQVLRAACFM